MAARKRNEGKAIAFSEDQATTESRIACRSYRTALQSDSAGSLPESMMLVTDPRLIAATRF
ncbi:hypothetical protein PCC6311_2607 [Synechococcus elongatus PCC 6311]|nr:hypothetical protein M744_03670 [Synechococcus elongatus UTEX 2973]UOW72339.1 hypothetical protein PCC7943_2607 [Synechococcus elongatus PCC 7943]UOW75060.1 hypothetical protein PCC6311_2607 [Synechococcus elongatus PCC 6311]UOW77780.1 hypothetical protein PCC6301pg_2608 [Synechococcus elongatus PCC 6301]